MPDPVSTYFEKHDLEEADVYSNQPGDVWERVVWGKIPDEIIPHRPSVVGLPNGEGVYGLHVGDAYYWRSRLSKDYDRPKRSAKVIEIKLAQGDRLVDDPQYATDPDTGDKSPSYVLLTSRQILRKGVDFTVAK